MTPELLAKAKSLGFSDRQIAHLTGQTEDAVRAERKRLGLVPSYRLVDTCAAEFEAYTPYYYSTYDRGDDEVRPSDKRKVMILGGGPNRIGQGIEFDYCCVHAAFALKEDGFETLMVNSNPETVSTDYDTSDKLFFEPLTLEDVLHIYEREKCWGAIAQFGGQTPLNLALGLQSNGVNIIVRRWRSMATSNGLTRHQRGGNVLRSLFPRNRPAQWRNLPNHPAGPKGGFAVLWVVSDAAHARRLQRHSAQRRWPGRHSGATQPCDPTGRFLPDLAPPPRQPRPPVALCPPDQRILARRNRPPRLAVHPRRRGTDLRQHRRAVRHQPLEPRFLRRARQ